MYNLNNKEMNLKFLALAMLSLCIFSESGKAQVVSTEELAMADKPCVIYAGNPTGMAAEAGVTVLASASNVLYRGYTNPIYVSAPGYTSISVSATGGATVAKGKLDGYVGEYIVTVPASCSANKITVNVSAGGKNIGHQTFKVYGEPKPLITIGGYENGSRIPKSVLKENPRFEAIFDSDVFFPFENVNYNVISFSYIRTIRGVSSAVQVRGNALPQEFIDDISKMAPGTSISFIDVVVVTPSGQKTFGFTAILE